MLGPKWRFQLGQGRPQNIAGRALTDQLRAGAAPCEGQPTGNGILVWAVQSGLSMLVLHVDTTEQLPIIVGRALLETGFFLITSCSVTPAPVQT